MSFTRLEARKIEHGSLRAGLSALIIHPFDGGRPLGTRDPASCPA